MSIWDVPAIIVSLLVWLQSPPVSLADAANREAVRRQLTPKSTRSLTNEDVERLPRRPLPTPPELSEPAVTPAAPVAPKAPEPEEVRDETWWRERMTAARQALERDQLLAESLQSRVNALTAEWSARDDPAQRQQLYEQRIRVLAELDRMKAQLLADTQAIADIEEDARRQNIPPGWIR